MSLLGIDGARERLKNRVGKAEKAVVSFGKSGEVLAAALTGATE